VVSFVIQNLRSAGALAAVALAILTSGCAHPTRSPLREAPVIGPATETRLKLERLRPPGPPVSVAVYGFPDLTGQHRYTPGLTYGDYSKAVTQGGGTLLMDVLRSAGGGTWFEVVERAQVDDLLRERKLIQEAYAAASPQPKDPKAFVKPVIPSIKFADYLLAGGITGYDRSIVAGGAGASYLGVSGATHYQKDVVNVTLRLIDVLSGKVLRSVNTSKTVYSISITAGLSRYVTVSNLLEVDGGLSSTEPTLLAVREAMELALYQMLAECVQAPTWCVPRKDSPSQYRPPVRPPLSARFRTAAEPSPQNQKLPVQPAQEKDKSPAVADLQGILFSPQRLQALAGPNTQPAGRLAAAK
jgi:curli production assembly/transport component CsgG